MTDQMTWQAPVVEVNGREYRLRRLGILDVMALGKIYASCQARQALQLRTFFGEGRVSTEMLGAMLIAAIPYESDAICKFLAGLVGVDVETFQNPDEFPLGSEVAIIEKLIEHEDVAAFFDRVQRVMKSGALEKLASSQSKSTGSKPKRAGQTKSS